MPGFHPGGVPVMSLPPPAGDSPLQRGPAGPGRVHLLAALAGQRGVVAAQTEVGARPPRYSAEGAFLRAALGVSGTPRPSI
jgi:hypothetical protein